MWGYQIVATKTEKSAEKIKLMENQAKLRSMPVVP